MTGADEGDKDDPKPDLGAMRTRDDGAIARQVRGPLRAGEVFAGRFQVQAHVGSGGAGDVYRVIDTRLNRSIALKLIHTDRLSGADAQARLMQEAATARDIRHANVVAVYDADAFEHQPFLTMEYLEG
ncbi:MAG TPA: protein kinase, partial [Hyphomonadaceae bacterium]|nr:protein kinase [Hyphomonadaceae bacterium]